MCFILTMEILLKVKKEKPRLVPFYYSISIVNAAL